MAFGLLSGSPFVGICVAARSTMPPASCGDVQQAYHDCRMALSCDDHGDLSALQEKCGDESSAISTGVGSASSAAYAEGCWAGSFSRGLPGCDRFPSVELPNVNRWRFIEAPNVASSVGEVTNALLSFRRRGHRPSVVISGFSVAPSPLALLVELPHRGADLKASMTARGIRSNDYRSSWLTPGLSRPVWTQIHGMIDGPSFWLGPGGR